MVGCFGCLVVVQQEVYLAMASCKFQMGDYESAIDWYQTAIVRRSDANEAPKRTQKGKEKGREKGREKGTEKGREKGREKGGGKGKQHETLASRWKVGHLMKRACQYMMALSYEGMEEPERARVFYAKGKCTDLSAWQQEPWQQLRQQLWLPELPLVF